MKRYDVSKHAKEGARAVRKKYGLNHYKEMARKRWKQVREQSE